MTRQLQSTELDSIVQLLAEHGFDGMAQAIELLLNEAMKLQRSEALRAGPRRGRPRSWDRSCPTLIPGAARVSRSVPTSA